MYEFNLSSCPALGLIEPQEKRSTEHDTQVCGPMTLSLPLLSAHDLSSLRHHMAVENVGTWIRISKAPPCNYPRRSHPVRRPTE